MAGPIYHAIFKVMPGEWAQQRLAKSETDLSRHLFIKTMLDGFHKVRNRIDGC
jgi:hypothetical protein